MIWLLAWACPVMKQGIARAAVSAVNLRPCINELLGKWWVEEGKRDLEICFDKWGNQIRIRFLCETSESFV